MDNDLIQRQLDALTDAVLTVIRIIEVSPFQGDPFGPGVLFRVRTQLEELQREREKQEQSEGTE